jgi:hypothetical protein
LGPALRNGIPLAVLGAVAIAAMVAMVVEANTRTQHGYTGFAEFSVTRQGCALERSRSFNAERCAVVEPGLFSITFLRPLRNTTPIVSRGSCCPGRVSASVSGSTVLVAFPRPIKREIRASVLLP